MFRANYNKSAWLNKSKDSVKTSYSNKQKAIYKRNEREKTQHKKQKARDRVKRHRETKRRLSLENEETACITPFKFTSRVQKMRALTKVNNALPRTPNKKIATIISFLEKKKSPTVTTLKKMKILTQEDEESELGKQVLENVTGILYQTKKARDNTTLTFRNAVVASVSGENVSCKVKLSSKLGVSTRKLHGGNKLRKTILTSEGSAYTLIDRRIRKNAISNDVKRIAYNFWLSAGVSRPTGNKKDVKRERMGPNIYVRHMVHLLEKTQTEVYVAFKQAHPDIQISQRSFEKCKPFFVRQPRQADRNTCCCRYCIEMQLVRQDCMKQRQILMESNDISDNFKVYRNVQELVDDSLCPKDPGQEHHNMECLERRCEVCGVNSIERMPEEMDSNNTSPQVTWERFEYVNTSVKGKTFRKLMLVKKCTALSELFSYMLHLLSTYAAHQFRSTWQNSQLKNLRNSLPQQDCICIHDFSENYQ